MLEPHWNPQLDTLLSVSPAVFHLVVSFGVRLLVLDFNLAGGVLLLIITSLAAISCTSLFVLLINHEAILNIIMEFLALLITELIQIKLELLAILLLISCIFVVSALAL